MTEQKVQIHDLSHDGRGVARSANGKTCFIAGALPGETIQYKTLKSKRSFDEGICTQILEPSANRVIPRCEYFEKCGGCELQHLDAQAQLQWKQHQLQSLFARAGLEPKQWMPPLHADVWNYRRRTRLAVVYEKRGRVAVGFREKSSKRVVDIGHCMVLDERLNQLMPELKALAINFKNKGLGEIELSAGDTQLAVCLSLKSALNPKDIVAIKARLPETQTWQKLPGKVLEQVSGEGGLKTQLFGGMQMEFQPGQFIQINSALNRAMLEQAINWVDPQPNQKMLDLFCGSGNFSLAFAPQVKSVLGAEGLDDLCKQGEQNALLNELPNLEFETVNLFESGQYARLGKDSFDIVVLDPPRPGAAELMPWLSTLGPEKILYVSCHPATMVRDIQMLSGVYQVEKVGAMNMFPHTTHLEAMTLLVKK
jgi:23S rRNA (uracil1939-C5)-methyltransferase